MTEFILNYINCGPIRTPLSKGNGLLTQKRGSGIFKSRNFNKINNLSVDPLLFLDEMAGMRSLISKIIIAVFAFGLLFPQVNFVYAASASDLYFEAQKSFYSLKASPEKQKFRHHWMKTIKLFAKVVDRFPKSKEAYKAEFTTGKLYEGLNAVSKNSKDLDRAIHHYNNVSANYQPANLSDDALFRVAELHFVKRNFNAASDTFKKVVQKYPEGDQARKAQEKYKSIRVAAKIKDTPKYPAIVKQSQPKPIAPPKKDIPVKMASAVVSDKKKIVAEFKEKTQKPVVKKIKQVVPAQPRKKVPEVVVRQAKKAQAAPVSKKRRNIKDGFGRGYLYNPKIPKRKQIEAPLIVVDAGHGGKDHGAMSASGIKEKDVNIKIAKHVKTILVNRYKYRVVMTRKDDTFIPLKDRSKISNKRDADLFVSIHANAAKRKSAHGIETYFLGTSHNEQALETAARENGELVKSVKDDQVQQILASLITTTKINDSSRLAGRVQENLYRSSKKKNRNLKNLGVKEGPFYVLHGADMPSILVEVGFLTNKKEARMLSKPDYLYRLASSIAEGIHKYLQDKGPSI